MRREEVTEALRRRALGYEADEVVEEYGFTEGEAVLLKRKVTKKDVPPDIQAAKLLLEAEEPARGSHRRAAGTGKGAAASAAARGGGR